MNVLGAHRTGAGKPPLSACAPAVSLPWSALPVPARHHAQSILRAAPSPMNRTSTSWRRVVHAAERAGRRRSRHLVAFRIRGGGAGGGICHQLARAWPVLWAAGRNRPQYDQRHGGGRQFVARRACRISRSATPMFVVACRDGGAPRSGRSAGRTGTGNPRRDLLPGCRACLATPAAWRARSRSPTNDEPERGRSGSSSGSFARPWQGRRGVGYRPESLFLLGLRKRNSARAYFSSPSGFH